MQRVTQFAFRVSKDERQAITDLAARLQRSQSDAVRFVIIEAAKQLAQGDATPRTALPAKDNRKQRGNNAGG